MNILVADDDRSSQLIAQTALRRLGHECEIVGDGDQAWEAFGQHHHDVVISDSMMPRLTGSQLCQKIRAGAGDYTYFIMVTSLGVHRQVLEGMAAGVDDYLIKPLNPEDLQARLVAAERVTALHHQLADQRSELQRLNATLGEISRHDPLTGLRNRRALEEDLEMLEPRVARYGHRYCMALLDVDHFKAYNDTYGHQAGDEVLKAVAGQLEDQARSGDAVYRYGGEEFLCIFPEQSSELGAVATERMRAGVERLAISHGATPLGIVTVSAGLSVLDPNQSRSTREVMQEADELLYRAKQLGRNRIEVQLPFRFPTELTTQDVPIRSTVAAWLPRMHPRAASRARFEVDVESSDRELLCFFRDGFSRY